MSPKDNLRTTGLRQRKKTRTHALIQSKALQLFRKHGYEETTVDQIAAAAEVSQSTFFRYFSTKEDLILHDDFDPLIAEAFRAQPPELTPAQALRSTFRSVFSAMSREQGADMRERIALILSVPVLRAAMLGQLYEAMLLVARLAGERRQRREDDLATQTFAGAVIGVAMTVMFAVARDPAADLASLFDEAMGHLETGLRL